MSQAKESSTPSSRTAYFLILAGVCAAMHVAKLSPALPILREELGISLLQAGFLLSMVQFAGMTLGLAVGLMADGLGLKRCMLTGLVILFVVSGLGGLATQVTLLLVLRVIEGFGFLLVTLSAPAMIRNSVAPTRVNRMMGFWGAYMSLGTAMALLFGPKLIQWGGWQVWWWALSALTLAMGLLIWLKSDSDETADAQVEVAESFFQTSQSELRKETQTISWKTRTYQTLTSSESWLLALCFFMYSGQWLAVIGFLPVIYEQAGFEIGLTAILTALVAAANMVGNIASGILLNRKFRPQRLLYTGFIVMALGSMLAFANLTWLNGSAADFVLRYVGILLFSMIGGLIPGTLFALAAQLTSGKPVLSTTVGWMQQWSAFGQFAGPPLVGWVAAYSGGWQSTWMVTGACSCLGLLLVSQISKRAKV